MIRLAQPVDAHPFRSYFILSVFFDDLHSKLLKYKKKRYFIILKFPVDVVN